MLFDRIKKIKKGNNVYCFPGFLQDFFEAKSIKKRNRKIIPSYKNRLTNKDFSILANDCIGGLISHDLGLEFKSPFVNIYISPEDFYKVLCNLDYYLCLNVVDVTKDSDYCPMGLLGDVLLWFRHSHSFEEGVDGWNRRKRRINYDNLFITVFDSVDKGLVKTNDYMSMELFQQYLSLPYKNLKIFTTDKRKKDSKNVIYLKKYRKVQSSLVPVHMELFGGHRIFDYKFDFVKWINEGK